MATPSVTSSRPCSLELPRAVRSGGGIPELPEDFTRVDVSSGSGAEANRHLLTLLANEAAFPYLTAGDGCATGGFARLGSSPHRGADAPGPSRCGWAVKRRSSATAPRAMQHGSANQRCTSRRQHRGDAALDAILATLLDGRWRSHARRSAECLRAPRRVFATAVEQLAEADSTWVVRLAGILAAWARTPPDPDAVRVLVEVPLVGPRVAAVG